MAPAIHPPCTPSATCTPMRCHPTPPPCRDPEKCLKRSRKKKEQCASALSIMSTRSSSHSCSCRHRGSSCCSREGKRNSSRSFRERKRGTKLEPAGSQCCEGRGHRGRIRTRSKCSKCWRNCWLTCCCSKCCKKDPCCRCVIL